MKLATWNVNSLRPRLAHLLAWLEANPVDVIGLQETKVVDEKFPRSEIEAAGYAVCFAGQPTYNGVALLTRTETIGNPLDVVIGNPRFADDAQRLITATCGGLRITCAYVPNGQSVESDKYAYKLAWLDGLIEWLREDIMMPSAPPRVVMGDFNIAPEDRDVHDPQAWAGQVLCSVPERARFEALKSLGFVDSFRLFEQPEKTFSWWDYRQLGFQKNKGLRIDHVMVARALASRVLGCSVDRVPRKWDKPSDHAPVVATIGD